MITNVELPDWKPAETPELAPPARTAQWAPRVGAPAANFLGRIRPRLIGASISFLFIPVGAVRLLFGDLSNPSAPDSWGPADAFVIVAAVLGVVALLSFVRSARAARANAAHSAWVLIRQANPGVTLAEIAPLLVGTRQFDEWARSRGIRPFQENVTAVSAERDGSRLMFARSVDGRYSMWVTRFGEKLARAFLVTRIEAWAGFVLVVGSVAADCAGVIAWFIESRSGLQPGGGFLQNLQLPLLLALVVGWALVLLARYGPTGRYAILDAMLPLLSPRDPKLGRSMIGAMFARPVMYDMWVLGHPAAA